MMKHIRLSAIQMNSLPYNIEKNVSKAVKLIDVAAEKKADIAVLPELFTIGYYLFKDKNPELFNYAEYIPGPTTNIFSKVAKEKQMHLVVPIFEKTLDGDYYNSATLIGPTGNIIGKYSKTHIPPRPEEKYYFKPGNALPVFETDLGKIGILICYDREFPEPFRVLALKSAQIVLVPSVIFPRPKANVSDSWFFINRARSLDNGVYSVVVNRSGKEDGMEYFGNSLIIDPKGKILAQAGLGEEVISAEISIENEVWDRRYRYENERRPEKYKKITEKIS